MVTDSHHKEREGVESPVSLEEGEKETHAQGHKLELDPEVVSGSQSQADGGQGGVVITPTGVNKSSSIDDMTTCTTSSDLSTPVEGCITTKRPIAEISGGSIDSSEPIIKAQSVEAEGNTKEEFADGTSGMDSSFLRGSENSIVFKRIETKDANQAVNTRTETTSTEVLSSVDTSKSTTASTSPVNQHQNNTEDVNGMPCPTNKSAISSKQILDELVQLAAASAGTGANMGLLGSQQLASVDNGVLQQSLLLLGGYGHPTLTPTCTGTPIKAQSPSSSCQGVPPSGSRPGSATDVHVSAMPSATASGSSIFPQLLSNSIFQHQSLGRPLSGAFGIGSHPFAWQTANSSPTASPGFCSAIPQPNAQQNVANIAAFLAAANSQINGRPIATVPFPTPVNRAVGTAAPGHSVLMHMHSATPSDASSTCDGTQLSTVSTAAPSGATTPIPGTNGITQDTNNEALFRFASGFAAPGTGGANSLPAYWHANPNLLASAAAASSLLGAPNDLSSTMALLNSSSLGLQQLLQTGQLVPHASAASTLSEDGSLTRGTRDTLSGTYNQQNCLPFLAGLQQQNLDLSTLTSGSGPGTVSLGTLANVAACVGFSKNGGIDTDNDNRSTKSSGNNNGNSGGNSNVAIDTGSNNSNCGVSGVGRTSHGGGSRSLNSNSSVSAAAAALDHLDVDWDSVGLREAELAAMEICKTASSLFDTTDGTTPVPSSPTAVGEAVLTAAQLTISARAMLKFVKGLTPTQLGINWHACTQRFCVTYTTRDEHNPKSWTLGAYSNGKLHYKYFGPRSWTIMGLKEALRKAFKARTSLLLGQGIIEEPEDTGLSKEELTYHARQLLQQLRDSLGVKKGNVHKGLYISWHPKTRRFVVALKSCESGKTIYKYFSPKERSIKGIKTALLDAHQMVVAACQ
ncbi:hypothetical protein FG379_002502 [Cryptosporidium bovis]|uniref:uncharacterized protein n=1 Tax=Cryptosporidium bovis TaxID=310047 RepID=UPI00351A75C0|nr:hypothetical protein FG379_002502 [Cryptosporidium bovis]